MSKYYMSFPSNPTALNIADEMFGLVISTLNVDNHEKHRLKLIVSELFTNAYIHGNQSNPDKYVDVTMDLSESEFSVVVRDQGSGLAKETFKAFVEAYADPMEEHGRGIKIMRKLSDKVDLFRDAEGRFCVRATKALSKNSEITTTFLK